MVNKLWRCRISPLPKGDAFRGLGIFNVGVRGWHRALRFLLPKHSPDQLASQGTSTAIGKWLSYKSTAGAEIDLAGAYDTVDHAVGVAALKCYGTPHYVADTLSRAWKAPRVVIAKGCISKNVVPLRSIPQGDPCAGDAFCAVTSPT